MVKHHNRGPAHVHRLLLAAAATLLLAVVLPGHVSPAGGQVPDLPPESTAVTVTVTPKQSVTAGDLLQVSVKPKAGYTGAVTQVSRVSICRDDIPVAAMLTLLLGPADATYCPPKVPGLDGSPVYDLHWRPSGREAVATMFGWVGTGDNDFHVPPDPPPPDVKSVTCDSTHPCRVVVVGTVLQGGTPTLFVDYSNRITYRGGGGAGCTKKAPGQIASYGPDRLSKAWSNLTLAACTTATGGAQPTAASFPPAGEESALKLFEAGDADLAYSAIGPRTPGLTLGSVRRPYVAVPVALNAVVLGAVGGTLPRSDDWPLGLVEPFTDPQVTIGQLASLVSRGPLFMDERLKGEMMSANQFADISYEQAATYTIGGPSATSWYATSMFKQRAPADWTKRLQGTGETALRPAFVSFAKAQPEFLQFEAQLYQDSSSLGRTTYEKARQISTSQADRIDRPNVLALVDLATARRVNLTPFALRASASVGSATPPTDASLQAAAANLKSTADGMSTPLIASSSDKAGAYPLTFVEYALVPAEPLLDEACRPRSASQAQLGSWLTYVTTAGQTHLPDGLAPLTPALQKQASLAIARVGKATPTGRCAPKTPPTTTPASAAPTGGGAGGPVDPGGSFGGDGSFADDPSFESGDLGLPDDSALGAEGALGDAGGLGGSLAAIEGATTAAATARPVGRSTRRAAPREMANASIRLPPTGGIAPGSTAAAALAVLLVAGLTSGTVALTSGRAGTTAAMDRVRARLRPGRRRP